MNCANRCYEAGGPWISEDPNCPIHGTEAQRLVGERDAVELAWREVTAEHTAQLEAQEQRIARLEELVSSLRDAVAGIRGYREHDE